MFLNTLSRNNNKCYMLRDIPPLNWVVEFIAFTAKVLVIGYICPTVGLPLLSIELHLKEYKDTAKLV